MTQPFPPGSVADNLMRMRGTWLDRVELFHLDGRPLEHDGEAGSPGASPFENLVYIDFDGRRMTQTNVTLSGRELSSKTFGGELRDGVLVFDPLGPGAYENLGLSGGPGVLVYNGGVVEASWETYLEPDVIVLTAPDQRLRSTVLYRHGKAVRSLTARGQRLAPDCSQRHPLDPRGSEGPVHGAQFQTDIWQRDH